MSFGLTSDEQKWNESKKILRGWAAELPFSWSSPDTISSHFEKWRTTWWTQGARRPPVPSQPSTRRCKGLF